MTREDCLQYSSTRLAHAYECLEDAGFLLGISRFKAASNRLYYAIFHAMRAAMILQGEASERKKHSGVLSEFRKVFIATGMIDKRYNDIITDASEVRNETDYDDFYHVDGETVQQLYMEAVAFVDDITAYLVKEGVEVKGRGENHETDAEASEPNHPDHPADRRGGACAVQFHEGQFRADLPPK